MAPLSGRERDLLTRMSRHLEEAVLQQSDPGGPVFTVVTQSHRIMVINDRGVDELQLVVSNGEIVCYLTDRNSDPWNRSILLFMADLPNSFEEPSVVLRGILVEYFSGEYRYLLKAIDADLDYALSRAVQEHIQQRRRELTQFEEVWGD